MSLGVVMLVHTEFGRAEQALRHWTDAGCPVVIHVDKAVPKPAYDAFVAAVSDLPDVTFSKRFRCEWGTWQMVAATQAASTQLLAAHPDLGHVYLASGTCLPLRPVKELCAYLQANHDADYIESATTADVPWTVGGLDKERFILWFPVSWKKRRRLFDRIVRFQRWAGIRRKVPDGIDPHMGSQWWCLTTRTLTAILQDTRRPLYDAYFRHVWIPDESYFQTLARKHSRRIESRSLTLSKFDFQGKPHIFYDDHFELLARSNCFVARKIWPKADLLYRTFPQSALPDGQIAEPDTIKIDRLFEEAVIRRTRGRHGLYMQSRFPHMESENGFTANTYSVAHGLDAIIPDFRKWLRRQTGAEVHGHLFGMDRAEFATGEAVFRGGASDNPTLRDYNPRMFLTNLMWAGRAQHQCFLFGAEDAQRIRWMLAQDTNARLTVVTGAWAVPLFKSGAAPADCRARAARLQRIENRFLTILRSSHARANIHVHSLSEFCREPREILQNMVDEIAGHRANVIKTVPDMVDLTGFGGFLQDLRNQGMHPFLAGEFSVDSAAPAAPKRKVRKPYRGASK